VVQSFDSDNPSPSTNNVVIIVVGDFIKKKKKKSNNKKNVPVQNGRTQHWV